ncbi:unnamed protein product [Orchesella dallaii]|uniref:Dynein regulatory complex protein 10 n=1 Tax=Orchesella dallaii TaxID=48710 RepID=A0ABP1QQ26_9HEXA
MENSSYLELDNTKQDSSDGGKRFLVAMDLALGKMEKLYIISTLCHHLKENVEKHSDLTSFTSSRISKKIRAQLGTETHDLLVQLVECQKVGNTQNEMLGKHKNHDDDDHVVGGNQAKSLASKKKLVRRLQENDAKRSFLLQIMEKAKAYFGSLDIASNNEDKRDSSLSIVSLLRDALQSKYRKHVRRCFRELDVESLTSILFLMRPSSRGESATGTHSSEKLDSRPAFLSSSIEDIEESIDERLELESYYFGQSLVSETPPSSVFFVEGEEEEEDLESSEAVKKGSQGAIEKEDKVALPEGTIKHQIIMVNEFSKALATSAWVNDELTIFQDLGRHKVARMHDAKRREYVGGTKRNYVDPETAMRILQLLPKLFANIPSNLPPNFLNENVCKTDEPNSYSSVNGMKNLFKNLRNFRAVAASLLNNNVNKEGASSNEITQLEITYRLLTIEEDRLKSKVRKGMATKQERLEELEGTLEEWSQRVKLAKEESDSVVRSSVKDQVIKFTETEKGFQNEISEAKEELKKEQSSLETTTNFVKQSTKSLRARRHYLEASLDSLIRQYDSTMLKYQAKIDELSVEEIGNSREIDALQNRFKDIEEKYDEMRATKRLKELLKNMEKAESIKQNWAARKIQMAWRRYKVAKLRKRKLKGRKRGKKKTPPPQDKEKGLSPAKTVTSSSRSRSKSQTP